MRQKSGPEKQPAEDAIRDIRRATRRHFSAEEKIRIVLEGLRGEESIAELCRREGIASSMYYGWSKEFLEAGKKRLAGDTARAATSDEVKDLRRETQALKEVKDGKNVVAEASTNRIRMMGAIRATDNCLKCHDAQHGDLLGTFTYELQRDPLLIVKK